MRVWTIGHGTRGAEEFLALLRENGIEALADVRRFPTSRWERFRKEDLGASLAAAGIAYVHLEDLGGYRSGGYPAYMETEGFGRGVEALLALAAGRRTAILCAESAFFRCHRRHVADALVLRGVAVAHILGPGRTRAHVVAMRLELGAQEGAPARPRERAARRTKR